MTCIVGLTDQNNIYIGADSAGVSGDYLQIRKDKKVFVTGNFIFGVTSSFRMGQLLKYKLKPPPYYSDTDVDRYIHVDFVDAVSACFRDNGYLQTENGVESGGEFVFGFRGRLYTMESDFQITQSHDDFVAVGCGAASALGCLYGLKNMTMPPETRIKSALESAEYYNTCVRRPFNIKELLGVR